MCYLEIALSFNEHLIVAMHYDEDISYILRDKNSRCNSQPELIIYLEAT